MPRESFKQDMEDIIEAYENPSGSFYLWSISDEELDENCDLLEENRGKLDEVFKEEWPMVVVYPEDRLIQDDNMEEVLKKGEEIKSYQQLEEIKRP